MIRIIQEQCNKIRDIITRYDEQIDYVRLYEEWEELCSDFADHFRREQHRKDLKLEWDQYTSDLYGLSSHCYSNCHTNSKWKDAMFRYKKEVWLADSFFDRWKRYRFLQYYDLSSYPNIHLDMEVMEQLRIHLRKLICDLNQQYSK